MTTQSLCSDLLKASDKGLKLNELLSESYQQVKHKQSKEALTKLKEARILANEIAKITAKAIGMFYDQ